MLSQSLDVFELARMEELQKQYMAEHFLSFYVMCQLAGETKSTETGQEVGQNHPSFSLATYIRLRGIKWRAA